MKDETRAVISSEARNLVSVVTRFLGTPTAPQNDIFILHPSSFILYFARSVE
jgi:hypothetical protein